MIVLLLRLYWEFFLVGLFPSCLTCQHEPAGLPRRT